VNVPSTGTEGVGGDGRLRRKGTSRLRAGAAARAKAMN